MNTLIIICAKYLLVVPVLVFMWLFYKDRANWKHNTIHALAVFVLSYVIAKGLGHFYHDSRPFVQGDFVPLIAHAADNGFPSDHTLLASALAAIVMCYRKYTGYVLWFVAIFIGVSRVYAGVHHPVDILGSMLIVLVVAALTHLVENRAKGAIMTP